MRYYIKNKQGDIVGKFDGKEVNIRDEDEIVEVGTVEELSEIEVEWLDYYNKQ